MPLPSEAQLLRVFVGERDKYQGRPLYEQIVREARRRGMAGATVWRGTMGFGARSRRIHTGKILAISEDLPMIVEIVDQPDRIRDFLPFLDEVITGGGLVTLERAEVIFYRHGDEQPDDAA
ncbi:DUF190 domain-containing protein [Thermostilla marina]